MQAAKRRLDSADVMVKGPEGGLRWRPLHAALVGRRCSMAALLGKLYAVGPQTGELTSKMLTAEPYCSCQLGALLCAVLATCAADCSTQSQLAHASNTKCVLLVDTVRPCTRQSGSCLWPSGPSQAPGPQRPLLTVRTSHDTLRLSKHDYWMVTCDTLWCSV